MSPVLVGIIFLLVGGVLAVAEIHTLTFYLLAIVLAAFVAAGFSFAGSSLATALFVFGIVALLALPATHFLRLKLKNKTSDAVSHDDVGRSVVVSGVDPANRLLRVQYRGTVWDARLDSASANVPATGASCQIVERLGNLLVVSSQA